MIDFWIIFDLIYAGVASAALFYMRKSNALVVYCISCVIVPCMAVFLVLNRTTESAVGSVAIYLFVGTGYAIASILAARKNLRSRIVYTAGAMTLWAALMGINHGFYSLWLIDRVVFQGIYSPIMAAMMLLMMWEMWKDWTLENGAHTANHRSDNMGMHRSNR